jgi:alcohol dehydrogenase class IV
MTAVTASSPHLVQRVSFRGAVSFEPPDLASAPTFVVVDAAVHDAASGLGLLDDAAAVVRLDTRPDENDVGSLAASAVAAGAARIAGIGSGALIDAVKRASIVNVELGLVLVPCGPEPYRAVARFAVVDDGHGERPTVVEERFAAGDVHVLADLLETRPADAVALHALDTAVQAAESLLSALANPYSQALARHVLAAVAAARRGGDTPETRVRLVVASFLAAEAFGSTRLGIAHAIASPLGTACAITHDSINGVIGRPMLDLWAPEAAAFDELCTSLFDELRGAAGLPPTVRELGIGWERVESILLRAARSSGMAFLPGPLPAGGVEAFARCVWDGCPPGEVLNAGRR